MKITYIKPSGIEMEVNDTKANREYAKLNKWVEKKESQPKKTNKPDLLDKKN